MIKSIVKELCESFQESMNRRELYKGRPATHKVEFISCLKPDSYWLPDIHIGSSATTSDKIRQAWTVEIIVDDVCIFRESYVPNRTEDLGVVEGMLITRVLKQVFEHGVMSSRSSILSLKQR